MSRLLLCQRLGNRVKPLGSQAKAKTYVSAANTAGVKAAPAVLLWVLDLYERIAKVLADKGYRGRLATLIEQAFGERQVELEISQRSEQTKGFQVEPKRWIVERTWTWLENARILTRDYERFD